MPVARESLDKAAKSAYARVVKGLKELGINVPEIDGPSAEAGLFGVQAIQTIDAALSAHAETKSARDENPIGIVTTDSASFPSGLTAPSTGKK